MGRLLGRGWSAPWVPGAVIGAGLVGAALAVCLHQPIGIPCPFRVFTGFPCPACGLTHAVIALGRGDIVASWHAHPCGVGVGALAIAAAADALVWGVRGSTLWPQAAWRHSRGWAAVAAAALLSVAILRWTGYLAAPP